MRVYCSRRCQAAALAIVCAWPAGGLLAQGIPEPSLVLYGVVRHATSGNRITVGPIQWTFRPAAGGTAVTVSGQLTNINDQFSYVLFVPVESVLQGQTATPNTLMLPNVAVNFDRSQVTVNGETAALVAPASGTFLFSRDSRGKVERIDLSIAAAPGDSDGNGLPDDWEMAYFSQIGVDPGADPDGDGLSNLEEWKAGTNPVDASSRFAFISVSPQAPGGVVVRWSSSAGKIYSVLRSATVMGGYAPIAAGVAATPPINAYHDTTAVGAGPYFYRLQLEE